MDRSTYKSITKDDVAKWRNTKGKLQEIAIPLNDVDGNEAKFVICSPTRNVLSAVTAAAQENDIDKVNDLLMENCVLGGDEKYIVDGPDYDGAIYLTLIEGLGKLMEPRRSNFRPL